MKLKENLQLRRIENISTYHEYKTKPKKGLNARLMHFRPHFYKKRLIAVEREGISLKTNLPSSVKLRYANLA